MRIVLSYLMVAMVAMSAACDSGEDGALPGPGQVCVYDVPDWVYFIERGHLCECTVVAAEDTCDSVCTISWVYGEDGSASFPGLCEDVPCCSETNL